MAEVERPVIVTVLAVMAVFAGVVFSAVALFSIISVINGLKIYIASESFITFLLIIVYCAAGFMGIFSGVLILKNRPRGIFFLRILSYLIIIYAVLYQIGTITLVGISGFSFWGLLQGLVFPLVVLIVVYTQQGVKEYERQVEE